MSEREKNKGSISQEQYAFYMRVGHSYTGYVDGIGEVSPATFFKGSVYNSLSKMYSVIRNGASILFPSLSPQYEAKKQQEKQEYERKKVKVRDEFIKLIETRYAEILQKSMFREVSPEYKNYRDKYNALRIKLQNKSQSPYSVIYKSDIPRDIINMSEVQEYFKFYNTQSTDPKQQYLVQNPDYYLTDYQKKQREDEKWRQKAYQNWYNADPIASQGAISLGYGVAAVPVLLCLPEISAGVGLTTSLGGGLRSAFSVSTEMAGLKAGMSWSAQALVNGPSEVNYVAVASDAFFTNPLTGALVGSVIDVRPFSYDARFYFTGYNKSLQNTAIDAGSAFIFGKTGGYSWGRLSPLMRNGGERYFMYFSTQMWNSVGGYGAAKKYTNQYGVEVNGK